MTPDTKAAKRNDWLRRVTAMFAVVCEPLPDHRWLLAQYEAGKTARQTLDHWLDGPDDKQS